MAQILDVNTMLGTPYEPKRKFRWLINIEGVDSFVAKSAARPQVTFGSTVIDFINQRRYVAGKATWATMNLVLNDPIAPSASQKIMEWIRLCWENVTGRSGYAEFYKKPLTLQMLDPVGAVVEQWTLKGAWIMDANFNDLDYTSEDLADIALVIQYDQAILDF